LEPALVMSIVSIVLTGLFGLWNLKITVESHQMKKDEFFRNKKKYLQEEFDKRPKLELVSYKKTMDKYGYKLDQSDIDAFIVPFIDYKIIDSRRILFSYDPKTINQNEWVNIQFKLKNDGKTAIKELYFACNSPQNTSVFDVKNDEYKIFIEHGAIQYRVSSFEEIKPQQVISIKVNFHKDFVVGNPISAEASLWLIDTYGNIWEQPIFFHHGKVYDSKQKTYKEFKEQTNWKEIIKYFHNPELW